MVLHCLAIILYHEARPCRNTCKWQDIFFGNRVRLPNMVESIGRPSANKALVQRPLAFIKWPWGQSETIKLNLKLEGSWPFELQCHVQMLVRGTNDMSNTAPFDECLNLVLHLQKWFQLGVELLAFKVWHLQAKVPHGIVVSAFLMLWDLEAQAYRRSWKCVPIRILEFRNALLKISSGLPPARKVCQRHVQGLSIELAGYAIFEHVLHGHLAWQGFQGKLLDEVFGACTNLNGH